MHQLFLRVDAELTVLCSPIEEWLPGVTNFD